MEDEAFFDSFDAFPARKDAPEAGLRNLEFPGSGRNSGEWNFGHSQIKKEEYQGVPCSSRLWIWFQDQKQDQY